MNKNILICGVGGQGTVLASRIIAASAMNMGEKVMSAETIGMAQIGGKESQVFKKGRDRYCKYRTRKAGHRICKGYGL